MYRQAPPGLSPVSPFNLQYHNIFVNKLFKDRDRNPNLGRANHILFPPPTYKTCPVIQSACSEAKKMTALAMSSGRPILLKG